MNKFERIISIIMLSIISLSNVATPVAEAAPLSKMHLTLPHSGLMDTSKLSKVPQFAVGDQASVLGATTSIFTIGTQKLDTSSDGMTGSAGKRIPLHVQAMDKQVYASTDDVTLAVVNPDNEPFTTTVTDSDNKAVAVPVSESNNGITTTVDLAPSNQIKPGLYKVTITDQEHDSTQQDFTWGVLAMNTDKSIYHPGETADIAMAVLNDNGDMVCDARVNLIIQSATLKKPVGLSTAMQASSPDAIIVNPQCQKHDYSLEPDYEAHYTFPSAGTYQFQLTATTPGGSHTITNSIQVKDSVPFDVQRVSATRIYPPNTYPMVFNIKANQDFSGTVTETVPDSFTITPATQSAAQSYTGMQTVYLNSNDPAAQMSQQIASQSGGLVMPFHGSYPITQGFGAQLTDPTLQAFYTQYGLAGHDGIDFGVPMDTPLYAVDAGTVIWSGPGDYGTMVTILHSWGQTYYGHMTNTSVTVGQHVDKGQLIGYSGMSGEATGPHLHFGMKPKNPDITNGYYGKIDPMPFLPIGQGESVSALGPTSPVADLAESTVLGASDSAATPTPTPSSAPTDTPTPAISGPVATPTPAPTGSTTPTPTSGLSTTPTPTVSAGPVSEVPTPTSVPSVFSNPDLGSANTKFNVLDQQIQLNEQIANDANTEKVKVITWNVHLKKGQSTSLGYAYQAPRVSPQFYLLGPAKFYSGGDDRLVFQEARQWEIASDDVGVEWFQNPGGPHNWNGYSWQYRRKIDIAHSQVSVTTGAPALDAENSNGNGQCVVGGSPACTSSGTVQLTVSSSDKNEVLILGIDTYNNGGSGATVSGSPTWNSTQTFTKLSSSIFYGGQSDVEFWYLVNPTPGTNLTASVTFTGNTEYAIGIADYYNVNPNTPFGPVATAQNTTPSQTLSNTIQTGPNQLAIDVLGWDGTSNMNTSIGALQTDTWFYTPDVASSMDTYEASQGSSTTLSYKNPNAFYGYDIGVALLPVAYTATGTVTPTLDSQVSTDNQAGTVHTLTWNHTVGNGPNRLLVVSVNTCDGLNTISSVTYGGTNMTRLASASVFNSSDDDLELWYLVAPAVGTASVLVTQGGANSCADADSISFFNVNQTTPLGTASTAQGSGTSITNTATTSNNQLVLESMASALGNPATPGAGQTEIWASEAFGLGSYKIATGPSTTMSWAISPSDTTEDYAVGINPATSSTTNPTVDFLEDGEDHVGTTAGSTSYAFYNSFPGTGTPSVSNSIYETGPDSLELSNTSAQDLFTSSPTGVLADSGRRISFYIYFSAMPTNNGIGIVQFYTSGSTFLYDMVELNTSHQICFNSTTSPCSSQTLSTNTWYRISIGYEVNAVGKLSYNVYLNGALAYSATGTSVTAGSSILSIGLCNAPGTAVNTYLDDVYVDSGTDLTDPGDIHVTDKRPITPATTTYSSTGSPSSGGSTPYAPGATGLAQYVSEDSENTANYLSTTTANQQQTFALESASSGFQNISQDTILGDEAWMVAETATSACTAQIVNNGTVSSVGTDSTSFDSYYSVSNGSSYPSALNTIGTAGCTSGTNVFKVSEEGMLIAYKSSPSVTFMESGTDATQGTQMYPNTCDGGTDETSDSTTSETGPSSLKITSGPSLTSGCVKTPNGSLGNAGRMSFYFKLANYDTPADEGEFYNNDSTFVTDPFNINGSHELTAPGGVAGPTTIQTGTWYRVAIAWNISSTTVFTFKIYLNGHLEATSTGANTTLTSASPNMMRLGWLSPGSNGDVMNIDDLYIDKGSDLSDPGDIHVTAKRPITNGTTNQFATGGTSGTGSGYGYGNAAFVNERPISTNNIVDSNTSTFANLTDEYSIENSSSGDVNLSSYYPIADEAWAYAESIGACTGATLINNGTPTGVNLTNGTYGMFTNIINNAVYPSGNNDVGMTSCANGTSSNYVNLEDAGMQIAYTKTDPNSLTNFPVLVSIATDTDLSNHAQGSGNDIVFTDSTGRNLLPYEIEKYSAGTLTAWVNVPALSGDNDTILYMYYGNPQASSLANASGVWDGNYEGVWHLKETPTGSAGDIKDSTSNANNGQSFNLTTAQTAGEIDGSLNFNVNSSTVIEVPFASSINITGDITLETWIKKAADAVTDELLVKSSEDASTTKDYEFDISSSNQLQLHTNTLGTVTDTNTTITGTGWHHVVVTRAGPLVTFYIDGSSNFTGLLSGSFATTSNILHIGKSGDQSHGNSVQGTLDEPRVSNIARSTGWISTEYNNENAPGTFDPVSSTVETDIYAPTLSQLMRHGEWFDSTGTVQPFVF